ncbi:MAG: glycosyltransferase family 9 protein [Bacteroidota bacterium]
MSTNIHIPAQNATATATIQTFLLIQTAFIGDVILATALIEKLRATYPTACIDFLVRKGNEGLLQGHPHLNEVLIWDKKQGKYQSLWRLLKYIRQQRYDYVINLQRFATTGWLTAFSRANTTIGFDKNPFSFLFTQRIPHQIEEGMHEVQRNLGLLRSIAGEEWVRPKLYPSLADYSNVRLYQTQPYVCIAPTSVWFTKQFPEHQWVKLIRSIPNNYLVYLLGSPQDVEACQRIMEEAGRTGVIILAGKLSLLASAALMQGAVLNYVNDSAPMHLCSALNAPTCAVYCSTVPAFGFGPLADFSRIIEVNHPLSCRPCGLHGYRACPEKHFKCANDIETKALVEVLHAASRH